MKRIVWLTDIHLELLQQEAIEAFLETIIHVNPDYVLISGDIAEHHLISTLETIEYGLQVPVYFVLGNHDYYYHSIEAVRANIQALSLDSVFLHWLPQCDVVALTEQVGLIGHDGWSDGRYGDYNASDVMLNDYVYIRDLRALSKTKRLEKLYQLGDEAGNYIRRILPIALKRFPHVWVVTHAPPFVEATWYEGNLLEPDDPYLPHFSCKAVGDALLEIAPQFPHRQITVLCGHTHSGGRTQVLDNLLVLTAGAEYHNPQIAQVFEVE